MNEQDIQKKLLRWYSDSKRSLPWRRTKDPYKILVSEILLQQTRVETATDYYQKFIKRFPTVRTLATAKQESVLQVWQGLGYYGRARNLHRTAQILINETGGIIPSDPQDLIKLPGIGVYTAGAVASIAFNRDVPVVDGNVSRVLCRVYAIEEDPAASSTRRRLHDIACRLLLKGKACSFNQALMELGALVCKPGRPLCPSCPLAKTCLAFIRDRTQTLPLRAPKNSLPVRFRIVAVMERLGRYLFERRPPEGLLGGLWELPGQDKNKTESYKGAKKRLEEKIRTRTGTATEAQGSPLRLKHTYSHFQEELLVIRYKGNKSSLHKFPKRKREHNWRWIHPNHLGNFPITGATRKILHHLGKMKTRNP